ncbi:hypothetical protein HIM_06449 [Hirsutella minnesotensis 3608]|uniref:Ubiquitin 3 binding protein But2 C-terminal domain-containing protein n=1 Tax=Hirsutella minnesotensis 3608 TaxID=1043627 RepID=A0A0F7ZU44_9HYPO|nr:hypothetical protein HIM_06449 [Hirsutella minnesotensis 3608]
MKPFATLCLAIVPPLGLASARGLSTRQNVAAVSPAAEKEPLGDAPSWTLRDVFRGEAALETQPTRHAIWRRSRPEAMIGTEHRLLTMRLTPPETPSETRVWIGFQITSEGRDPEWCYALVHVPAPARVASFADQPCVGNNFTASWGYRPDEDAGILTLSNLDTQRTAWFGWNHVNNSTELANVGPNPTNKTGKK